jgi:uncharacterized protein
MKVELSKLEEETLSFSHQVSLDPAAVDPDQVAEQLQVSLEGRVHRQAEGFLLEGTIGCAGALLCCRCLASVPWQLEESFAVQLRPQVDSPDEEGLELEDEELEVVFYADEVLDLDQVAAEQVLLALPMKTVCSAECAGLCPRCGGNLNREGECRCEPEVDSRWEALRGLKVGQDTD